jgi:hypothetical protein
MGFIDTSSCCSFDQPFMKAKSKVHSIVDYYLSVKILSIELTKAFDSLNLFAETVVHSALEPLKLLYL